MDKEYDVLGREVFNLDKEILHELRLARFASIVAVCLGLINILIITSFTVIAVRGL